MILLDWKMPGMTGIEAARAINDAGIFRFVTKPWSDHDLKAAFHDIHEREYSRRFEEADVQIANVRVRAVGVMPGLEAPQVKKGKAAPPNGA